MLRLIAALAEARSARSALQAEACSESGHLVDRVVNGRDGLMLGRSQIHDVMIVDRMLPGTGGLSLVRIPAPTSGPHRQAPQRRDPPG